MEELKKLLQKLNEKQKELLKAKKEINENIEK